MSGLSRDSPTNRGYYAESSQARALTIGDLGHPLHISTFCAYYSRVMWIYLCHSNCMRAGRLTPRRSMVVEKGCLRRWGVTEVVQTAVRAALAKVLRRIAIQVSRLRPRRGSK